MKTTVKYLVKLPEKREVNRYSADYDGREYAEQVRNDIIEEIADIEVDLSKIIDVDKLAKMIRKEAPVCIGCEEAITQNQIDILMKEECEKASRNIVKNINQCLKQSEAK